MGPSPEAAETDASSVKILGLEWFEVAVNMKRRQGGKEEAQNFNVYKDEKFKEEVLEVSSAGKFT